MILFTTVTEAPRAINLNTNSSENTIEGDTVQVLCESQGNPPPNIWWVNQPPDMQGSFELINYNMLLNQRQVSIVTVSVFSDFQPPKTVSTLTISNIIPAPEISHCYSENVFGSYGFDGITTNVSGKLLYIIHVFAVLHVIMSSMIACREE